MIEYKNYKISYNPKPIPTSVFDWDWQADGFDGAIDSQDDRAGTGSSVDDCKRQIDELLCTKNDA